MPQFPFFSDPNYPLIPADLRLNIQISNAAKPREQKHCQAVIDTASYISVIPHSAIRDLELTPKGYTKAFPLLAEGVTYVDAYMVNVEIDIGLVDPITVRNLRVMTAPDPTCLIGRDIFNQFMWTMNGPASRFTVDFPRSTA